MFVHKIGMERQAYCLVAVFYNFKIYVSFHRNRGVRMLVACVGYNYYEHRSNFTPNFSLIYPPSHIYLDLRCASISSDSFPFQFISAL